MHQSSIQIEKKMFSKLEFLEKTLKILVLEFGKMSNTLLHKIVFSPLVLIQAQFLKVNF